MSEPIAAAPARGRALSAGARADYRRRLRRKLAHRLRARAWLAQAWHGREALDLRARGLCRPGGLGTEPRRDGGFRGVVGEASGQGVAARRSGTVEIGRDHFSIRSSIADGRRIGLSASPLAQRVTISVQSY